MNGASLDIKANQLEQFKSIFPEVFTENKIDWEKLKAVLGDNLDFENERYALNWAGKSDAIRSMQESTTFTLLPQPGESIHFDVAGNVFIEGENLEVLKVLQKSYNNRIKCIIIDPPYNTGNDSFIYPDNFKERKTDYEKRVQDRDAQGYLTRDNMFRKNSKDNGHFHSNWLSMMYPRLFLARNLLKDDGVIFVFIDDKEIHNLIILMNLIFGEENYVASIVWKHTQQSKNDEPYFSRHYNSIVTFRKTSKLEKFRFERTQENNKNYSNPDNDVNGDWRSGDVRSPSYRKTLCYPLTTPSGKFIPPPANGWRWSEEEILKKIETGEIIFNAAETKIIRKIYLQKQEGRTAENLWDGEEYGTTRVANAELKALFEDKTIFDTPKPVQVIKKIIELATQPDSGDIILDFFAGSGTTAHAVIEKNKEDNGNRTFIVVQFAEPVDENHEAYKLGYKTIAEITNQRITRIFKKYPVDAEKKGFKSFKLAPSNFKIWQSDSVNEENIIDQLSLFTEPVKQDADIEAMLYELLLKTGYPLTEPIIKTDNYYSIDKGKLIIVLTCLNDKIIDSVIALKPSKFITLDSLFKGNDQLKTNTALQLRDAGIDFKTL